VPHLVMAFLLADPEAMWEVGACLTESQSGF
jgi:hypothetical protein